MQTYEVEIKSLLGSAERAQALRDAMRRVDPSCTKTSENKQLNHYFEGGTLQSLARSVSTYLNPEQNTKLADLSERAKEFSVRTREKDGTVILVVKASVGDDTSANGVSRMEFEATVSLTLAQLDQIILDSGFSYQAKWSREREEYTCGDITVCLDKNAGYGYLAEFERVVDDESKLGEARSSIDAFMNAVHATELPQDRLERMFAYYNANWPSYYGTDKIFTIE